MKKLLSTLVAAATFAGGFAAAPAFAQESYIGQIIMGGWNFCPRGTASAEGQLLPISSNTALFSLYGTFYGGDGRTTFGLPDLRGRAPIGQGTGPGLSAYREGQKGGAESVVLTVPEMPAHSHSATSVLKGVEEEPATSDIEGAVLAQTEIYAEDAPNADFNAASVATTIGSAGGNQAHENRMPFSVIRYCVVTQGIFPSRS